MSENALHLEKCPVLPNIRPTYNLVCRFINNCLHLIGRHINWQQLITDFATLRWSRSTPPRPAVTLTSLPASGGVTQMSHNRLNV